MYWGILVSASVSVKVLEAVEGKGDELAILDSTNDSEVGLGVEIASDADCWPPQATIENENNKTAINDFIRSIP